MDNLIFDRMSGDVDVALRNPNDPVFLKGAYNYTDLNRVEEWCEYLQEKLADYGFSEKLVLKQDWNVRDYSTRTQIDRIRNNIKTLKNYCYSLLTEEIIYNNTLNYEQANVLEKILFDIKEHMKEMTIFVQMNYMLGPALVQKKYITLETNNDVLEEQNKIKMKENIDIVLISKKYIILRGE